MPVGALESAGHSTRIGANGQLHCTVDTLGILADGVLAATRKNAAWARWLEPRTLR
jgi:hypothetical protein